MLKGLGCLAVIFFLIFFVMFRVLRNIFRALTGDDPARRAHRYNRPYRNDDTRHTVNPGKAKDKREVIPDDEGEYIEYEDVEKK